MKKSKESVAEIWFRIKAFAIISTLCSVIAFFAFYYFAIFNRLLPDADAAAFFRFLFAILVADGHEARINAGLAQLRLHLAVAAGVGAMLGIALYVAFLRNINEAKTASAIKS